MVGTITNGSTLKLNSASFQSVCRTTNSNPAAMNVCRIQSARMCDDATWIFSMSSMMDDISRPVELLSKNCESWRSTRSKTFWRRSVTTAVPTQFTR